MYVFFECVAEAVAEKGIRGVVAELVPGGGYMFDIAKSAWEKYSKKREMKQIRDDVQQMAQANFEEAKKAAIEAANQAARNQPEIIAVLETFLAQIPAATRQSLKRADDPTGTTVPANFSLRGPEDVAKLLPPSLPRFKPGDPLPGKAGWLLEKQLGIGGFGEVWLARKSGYESLLGAVKFCRSLDTRDRDLLHESKVIDQLLKHGDHPNIVKLMDVHLEGDAPWLMYEYVEGGDLTDLIHQWSALPPSDRQQRALAALQELAAAIGHFHRLDPAIVHRDLKPANILRDKTGRLRITDFGISGIAAKHMIENETRGVTTRAGRLQSYLYGSYTPLYASPQQKDGEAPDPRDDVHALGVIGYQMLTGQVNSGVGPDFAQDLKEIGVDTETIKLLGRCSALKLHRRPSNAAEIFKHITVAKPPAPKPPITKAKGKLYVARICWNEHEWVRPSGPKHENGTFAATNGFGFEEWLFSPKALWNEWQYGFVQGVFSCYSDVEGSDILLVLFAIAPPPSKDRVLVAELPCQVLRRNESQAALEHFQKTGVIDVMRKEIAEVNGNVKAFEQSENTPWVLFNIRYRLSDAVVHRPATKIPKENKIWDQSRYKLFPLSVEQLSTLRKLPG